MTVSYLDNAALVELKKKQLMASPGKQRFNRSDHKWTVAGQLVLTVCIVFRPLSVILSQCNIFT